jgi:hypothetical protein
VPGRTLAQLRSLEAVTVLAGFIFVGQEGFPLFVQVLKELHDDR